MIQRALLAGLVSLVLLSTDAHSEERAPFLDPLQLPTLDGKTVATWKIEGKKLLLIEFASW